jgi:hypothetical protein
LDVLLTDLRVSGHGLGLGGLSGPTRLGVLLNHVGRELELGSEVDGVEAGDVRQPGLLVTFAGALDPIAIPRPGLFFFLGPRPASLFTPGRTF